MPSRVEAEIRGRAERGRARRAPDFIGLGARRAGTTWIYGCLHAHPELCMPIKEIHFFSDPRNWARGPEWYEEIFGPCRPEAKTGEFSTSYLMDQASPGRIRARYPGVKLIASLRDPVDRAYSNYLHDIRRGVVRLPMTFADALEQHPEYIDQGRYAIQLERYLRCFPREQLLVLIYEDAVTDPSGFVRSIYGFVGVDPAFGPSTLHARVNVGSIPRFMAIERTLNAVSRALRRRGLHRLWWATHRLGLGNRIGLGNRLRALSGGTERDPGPAPAERAAIRAALAQDVERLEQLLERKLSEWQP
jgi:Sulfotransferase domain